MSELHFTVCNAWKLFSPTFLVKTGQDGCENDKLFPVSAIKLITCFMLGIEL